ncbi:hypothetical protein AJ78_00194 [Emergomyces pasteurianus Ep9510]|uniref:Uncharacterized protein n=1 Tax=Emergomyces pasteurianus Ep9510 TaxID=1447872 RepID=A0A1J9QI15_9EURO|nr:hypothetical protein AJ78_00194 [Emergomyces pasteurianus Ep9510]
MEQVGSCIRPWFAFLSCIWDRGHERVQERPTHDVGVAREMKLCHDQPHLVPPMKLVFYDDLPDPGGSRSSSISHWVSEGWTLASRATDRASFSTRRKAAKRTSNSLTISDPADFRRLNPPVSRLEPFRPLELTIYQPGNRLSDLPEFDGFDIAIPNKFESSHPKPPAKVFSPIDRPVVDPPISSFTVPRKPVGSTSYRPLSVSDRIEVHDHRPPPPEPIRDAAPKMSAEGIRTRNSAHVRHSRTISDPLNPHDNLIIDSQNLQHATNSSREIYNMSFPSPPVNTIKMASHKGLIQPNAQPKTSADLKSPRSHKVTQWLFPKPPSSTPDPASQGAWSSWASRPQQTNHSTIHCRTLSGSTASSANNSSMTACSGRTPSLSSAITATTVQPPPSIQGKLEQDTESMGITTALAIPHGNKMSASRLEEPCPTVYEADHHHFHHHYHHDENDKFLVTAEVAPPINFTQDRVGVAF